jgi:FAD/FMN-containing dehydrogenase
MCRRWRRRSPSPAADLEVRAVVSRDDDRPAAVKQRFDPDNVFHINQNIPPA